MSRTHHRHRNPYAIMRAVRKGEKKELREQFIRHRKLTPVERPRLTRELRFVIRSGDL